jgi:hypothetical protein
MLREGEFSQALLGMCDSTSVDWELGTPIVHGKKQTTMNPPNSQSIYRA